jgi:NAD(P)-dependent dehydrogenase (short-subunit alcohol dehydrogenase family)
VTRREEGLDELSKNGERQPIVEVWERKSISFPDHGVAVIFGANGGIGRALVDQLGSRSEFGHVAALSRYSVPSVDLEDDASIAGAAQYVSNVGDLRLVIDATGFLHDISQGPEKSWREIEPGKLAHAFSLNAIGPALMLKHLLPLLPRSGKAVFATLSARVGSIGDNKIGGWYSYRASKAALNQLVRTAAIELKRQRPEAICVALHPGTVDTPLSAPFRKIGLEVQSPAVAAERLLAVIDRLEPHDSGGFFDHKGKTVPW